MKKYLSDKTSLPIPWVESPFFYSLLQNSDLTDEEKELCTKYHEDGYVVIDAGLSAEEMGAVVDDMYAALAEEDTVYHADHFQYTESKRIFELWKQSNAAASLCINEKIMETLRLLYDREPIPFSTINFIKGSNQPLHSDVIHFHTYPKLWMCGVWVAFEDVDETNGSLKIVPGSHKWNLWEYDELGYPHPDNIADGEEVNYREYENFITQLVKEKGLDPHIAQLKKGQALIWSANLLHGGSNVEGITDLQKTRLTQAQHYFFEGCEKHYHPMFSQKYEGEYALKWCSDENNIQTFLETGKVNIFGKTITRNEK
jgi:ectoine hydroxylase-related dioxygenase (phytanoyl-CoA dioxygenase family)